MKRANQVAAMAVALGMASAGCFGSFTLTRKLYRWNDQVSQDKWIKEIIFIVLALVPVYELSGLGDAIVFNSIEFWTGNNPIEPKKAGLDRIRTKRIARHGEEAVLTQDGDQLIIEQFQQGRRAASVSIRREGDVSVASDRQGTVLFIAQTLPDGRVLIRDAQGRQTTVHSRQEAQRVAALWGGSSTVTE